MDDLLLVRLIQDLQFGDAREEALQGLENLVREDLRQGLAHSSQRAELAPVFWSSFGTVSILISEVVQVYPQLKTPATLTAATYTRASGSLRLLLYMAMNPVIRLELLLSKMPELLYPLLHVFSTDQRIEVLRATAVFAVWALLQDSNTEVNSRIMSSEIIPLCLGILEAGFCSAVYVQF